MAQRLDYLKETPSQTAGPYVHIGTNPNRVGIHGIWAEDLGASMLTADIRGERIVVTGCIRDGGGGLVRDALVELWQADAEGLHNSPEDRRGKADSGFLGWGRQPTDAATGLYRFETIKPGRVPWRDGRPMAPHMTLWIVARGINIGLHTRLYFADEAEANAADPILARVDPARVGTLIAAHAGEEHGVPVYRFDIRLQGEGETVFFDI
jgi:protocatechuate 3,4-dioxygenase alpha subunit